MTTHGPGADRRRPRRPRRSSRSRSPSRRSRSRSPTSSTRPCRQTTSTVKKTVPKTTDTVKKAVPQTTNTVKKACRRRPARSRGRQTITQTVTGGGSGGGGPAAAARRRPVRPGRSDRRSGDRRARRHAGLHGNAVRSAAPAARQRVGGSAGRNDLPRRPGGGRAGPSAEGPRRGGGFGGGPGAAAGAGIARAMLAGASPKQLRSVLAHLEGCLPALPAVDRAGDLHARRAERRAAHAPAGRRAARAFAPGRAPAPSAARSTGCSTRPPTPAVPRPWSARSTRAGIGNLTAAAALRGPRAGQHELRR